MSVQQRNNVNLLGSGATTLVFVHGFGCDQNMWRYVAPAFVDRYQVLLFDLVGSGLSDLAAYQPDKYASLDGYAADLLEIIEQYATGPVIMVGHSVSAIIGALADLQRPECFVGHVMVSPSPCYINDGDYVGGFERTDIEALLDTLASNYLGWSSTMAPAIMGAPDQPQLGEELINSFCRTDPDIARRFARVTFASDHRAEVARVITPTLILQCSDDIIAPPSVGDYLLANMPAATLQLIDNIGHCPHLSAPAACVEAIERFLPQRVPASHAG